MNDILIEGDVWICVRSDDPAYDDKVGDTVTLRNYHIADGKTYMALYDADEFMSTPFMFLPVDFDYPVYIQTSKLTKEELFLFKLGKKVDRLNSILLQYDNRVLSALNRMHH